MGQIPVASAARVLGLSERGLRRMISTGRVRDASMAGQPAAVHEDDVIRLLHERRAEASRRQPDALEFARFVRRTIWPDEELDEVVLADGRRDIANPDQAQRIISAPRGRTALSRLTEDAVALFGRAAVETTAMPRETWKANCRWCYADASARALGGLRPVDSPAYVALLGSQPCRQDRSRWAEEDRELKALRGRLNAAQTARERAAEQARARREFQAATEAARAAQERRTAATRRLVSVDPSSAVVTASGRRAPGSLSCGCTRDVYCPAHAAVFGTTDRTTSRR